MSSHIVRNPDLDFGRELDYQGTTLYGVPTHAALRQRSRKDFVCTHCALWGKERKHQNSTCDYRDTCDRIVWMTKVDYVAARVTS